MKLHSRSSSSGTPAMAQMDDASLGAMLLANNSSSSSSDDPALREVLRNLNLSPDLIDESAAAIYAHVRDPIEHPVDKELARLCTSEYTRGALHALSLYLAATSAVSSAAAEPGGGQGRNATRNSAYEVVVDTKNKPASPKRGRTKTAATTAPPSAEAGAGAGTTGSSSGRGKAPSSPAPVAVGPSSPTASGNTSKLTAFWNMLSKPSNKARAAGVVIPTEEEDGLVHPDHQHQQQPHKAGLVDEDDHRTAAAAAASPSVGNPPAKLNVRVGASTKNNKRPNSLLAGLGLGSPSGRAAGEVATPRRAPVRTRHWKLGHEIGKGSFGAVHIGLNEDTGVRAAACVCCTRMTLASMLYLLLYYVRKTGACCCKRSLRHCCPLFPRIYAYDTLLYTAATGTDISISCL